MLMKKRPQLSYRSISLRKMENDLVRPLTLDREARSVDVTAATETPSMVFDYDRWEPVPEVLLMSGVRLPRNRQIPLLDSHNRWSSSDVLGSGRNLRVEGQNLVATTVFSTVERAEEAFTKMEEGHLTDFSVGYRVNKFVWVPEKQSQVINGKSYTGPLKVVTDWTVKELSITPIGADEQAKARSFAAVSQEEENGMDKRLRRWLEARGLAVGATDEEAWEFFESLEDESRSDVPIPVIGAPAASSEPPGNLDAVREQAAREELSRITEIRAMAQRFDLEVLGEQLIMERRSVEDARRAVLDAIGQRASSGLGFRPAVDLVHDERDKFRSACLDSILIRGNVRIEQPAPGAMDLRGMSLRELAREALRIAGQPIFGDPREMVGRALTSSDFPYILSSAANKFLFDGYETAPETWQQWCGVGSVSDFKTQSLVRPSEFDDLEEVPEHGDYRYGGRSEGREQYAIATYGKLFAITRQAIINDDLNALSDVPRGHGESAARKVGDVAYAVLTANSAMGDGVALFHANHGNLGTGGAVSVTTIGEGEKLMALQKDIGGKRRLNIKPQFFIAPVTIKAAAEIFFNTMLIGGASNQPNLQNIYAGAFTRIYEPRLDDASTTAWYLAGPRGKTVTVFFLNGNQAPYMETKEGWSVDGVEYKVRIDAGAKAVDWKALLKNAGA